MGGWVESLNRTTTTHPGFSFFFPAAEGEQLPPVPAGPGPAHHLPALLLRQVPPRVQAHTHGPEAGEHTLPQLGLGGHLQPQKGEAGWPEREKKKKLTCPTNIGIARGTHS